MPALVLPGLPPGAAIGLDLGPTAGTTASARFCGFSDVPEGLHLLRWGEASARFICVASDLLPLRYSEATDSFYEDIEHVDNYAQGFARGDFANGLVPYTDDSWPELCSFVTLKLLSRCNVSTDQWIDPLQVRLASAAKKTTLKSLAPSDRSPKDFAGMLKLYFQGDVENCMGELQLAFILLVSASSFEALQSWLGTVRLLSESWPPEKSADADIVFTVLGHQLDNFPTMLLAGETDSSCLLRDLSVLFNPPSESKCRKAYGKTLSLLFGIEADHLGEAAEDDEEFHPVVVDVQEANGKPTMRVESLDFDDSDSLSYEKQGRMSWMV